METMTLEDKIQEKQKELERRTAAVESYGENCGRDRWYNRGRHDITTLREELNALLAERDASSDNPSDP